MFWRSKHVKNVINTRYGLRDIIDRNRADADEFFQIKWGQPRITDNANISSDGVQSRERKIRNCMVVADVDVP